MSNFEYLRNDIINGCNEGYYISYLGDNGVYGSSSTALVCGQMQYFLMLKGDHRANYKELAESLENCLDYFEEHIAESHKMSDRYDRQKCIELAANYLEFLERHHPKKGIKL